MYRVWLPLSFSSNELFQDPDPRDKWRRSCERDFDQPRWLMPLDFGAVSLVASN